MVETLLTAALRNPTLQRKGRSQLLFAWSGFQQHGKQDVEGALRTAREGASIDQYDLDAQIQLIIFLINMHQGEEAKTNIDRVRRLDRLNLKTDILNDLERVLPKTDIAR
jgi:hypothetical protein